MNKNDVSSVFDKYEPLECKVCSKDLLEEGQGTVVFVRPFGTPGSKSRVVAMYASCKYPCDRVATAAYRERECYTSWADLQDLIHPQGFASWDMALMNWLHAHEDYSDEAFETLKEIKLKISQKVFRSPSPEERDKYLQDQRWRDTIGPL
jgi:hypothetical protein